MTKLELFEYLNSGIDKSGNLKKESGFKKHFPEMYNEFIKTEFPLELQNLPFKQKLWHFLNGIYTIPVCKICGNPVNFLTRKSQWGYCTYCSGTCAMKDDVIKEKLDSTKLTKYGSRTYNNSEKQKQTISNNIDYELIKTLIENVIDKKLDMIINGVLEETDTTVSDCFFSFSNEDYIEMIQQTELEKYSATYTGGDGSPATKYSKDALLDALDSINSTATMNETITEITKTVYDIASIPSEDSSVKASDGSVAMANSNWLNRIVSAIMKPIVKSLLTPQVMLLFVINLEAVGMLNIDGDFDKIYELILKKILSLFVGLARYIRDKIVEFLLKLFKERMQPMLVQWSAILVSENINDWIRLLLEAIQCIPRFNIKTDLTEIDNVQYADIVKTQDIPESSQTC